MADPRPLVLLVQLPIPPPGGQAVVGNVPLAAGYLKLFARRRGLEDAWRIEILPPALADTLGDEGLVAAIRQRRPRLVGFTCYLWNVERTLWIAGRLKQADPHVGVLVGGPEITADNRWVRDHPAVDYAIVGEGEQTFAELLAALAQGGPLDGIAGLVLRGGRPPRRREPLADLEAVCSPYLEGILDAAGPRQLWLETARGCRYRCKYCYYPKSYPRPCFLAAERIEAVLRRARECGVAEVFLLDPTLNQRPDFVELLQILAHGNPDRQFTYSAELRAEGIDAATARMLRHANFQEVEIGLQSVEAEAQRLMGRRVDLAAFERGARAMLDEGLRVRVDLILGLPGDTPDSFRRGIDYLNRTRVFSEIQVFNLSILPGTAFRRQAAKLGLEYQPRPPYYVLKTPSFNVPTMRELMEEAQEAFGIEFDAMPLPGDCPGFRDSPQETPKTGLSPFLNASPPDAPTSRVVLDLDCAAPADALGPAAGRAQSFTLWLRAADFHARRHEAVALLARLLADNPHTTLDVVLEPMANARRLTPETLEMLLAACYRSPSYLDWYYSMHPGRLLGAKRLIVLVREEQRLQAGTEWAEAVSECATIQTPLSLWERHPESTRG